MSEAEKFLMLDRFPNRISGSPDHFEYVIEESKAREYARLKSQEDNQELVEALRFYADKTNWCRETNDDVPAVLFMTNMDENGWELAESVLAKHSK